jgi:hypothetical protein
MQWQKNLEKIPLISGKVSSYNRGTLLKKYMIKWFILHLDPDPDSQCTVYSKGCADLDPGIKTVQFLGHFRTLLITGGFPFRFETPG